MILGGVKMNPIAFSIGPLHIGTYIIGPFSVHWYGLILATAVVVGILISMAMAKKIGLSEDTLLEFFLWVIPIAVICSRIYYVIFSWDMYKDNPITALYIWRGGLAIHGTIIGSLITAILFCKIKKVDFFKLADILVICLALGQSIGRWGNFVNQEAYGYIVDKAKVPWAMFIDGAWRHPTFLYESIWDFCVFLFLLVYYKKKKNQPAGEVMGWYFILYSVGRCIVEGFRTDSLMLGPIRMAQLISIVLAVAGIILIVVRRKMFAKGLAALGSDAPIAARVDQNALAEENADLIENKEGGAQVEDLNELAVDETEEEAEMLEEAPSEETEKKETAE